MSSHLRSLPIWAQNTTPPCRGVVTIPWKDIRRSSNDNDYQVPQLEVPDLTDKDSWPSCELSKSPPKPQPRKTKIPEPGFHEADEREYGILRPIRRLGQGAEGVCGLYMRPQGQRLCVIKKCTPRRHRWDRHGRILVSNETNILVSLIRHVIPRRRRQNICHIMSHYANNGTFSESMFAYCEGETLHDLMKRCKAISPNAPVRLPPALILHIATQLAAALVFIHKGWVYNYRMELFKQVGNNVGAWNGIVHRDIKPANVLLKWHDRCDKDTPYPEIVLSDFGHAIEMHDTISKFSNYNKYSVEQPSKIHFSTPDFSPPEHLRRYSETGERGELDPDESYDWYQFGALLYYMCTGYCFDIDSKDEPLHHAWNLYSFTALSIHSIPNLTLRHNPHKRMDDPNAKKCLPAWHRESQVAEKKAFRVDDYGTRHFLEAGPALERLIDIRLQADDPGGLNGGDVRENDHIPPPQPDFDGNQDENNDFPSLHGYNGRIEVIEGVSVPTPPTSSLPSTWAIPPNYTNSYRQTAPLPVNPCTGRRAGS